jgi:hypothetical protein
MFVMILLVQISRNIRTAVYLSDKKDRQNKIRRCQGWVTLVKVQRMVIRKKWVCGKMLR